jgi:hypothetical protein
MPANVKRSKSIVKWSLFVARASGIQTLWAKPRRMRHYRLLCSQWVILGVAVEWLRVMHDNTTGVSGVRLSNLASQKRNSKP